MSKPTTRKHFKNLRTLVESNLHLLKEGVDYIPRESFDDTGSKEKTRGSTVGKTTKIGDAHFLLKKSSRLRAGEYGEAGTRSKDMDLEKNNLESFIEKCASEVFAILKCKKDYLPKCYLVTSKFNKTGVKLHNAIRKDNLKIYVASQIIGDPNEVNDHIAQDLSSLITRQKVGRVAEDTKEFDEAGEQRAQMVSEDLFRNVLLMVIVSNYDLKPDNFLLHKNSAIPIDFGNAQFEEKLFPDILPGTQYVRGEDDSFSSRSLRKLHKDEMGGGILFRKLYNKKITPQHFLESISELEGNQKEIEQEIWDATYKFTLGDPELKTNSANNIVSRLRNFVKLKEPLMEWSQLNDPKSFPNHNVRNIVAKSTSFRNSQSDSEMVKLVNGNLEYLLKNQNELLTCLRQYGQEGPEHKENDGEDSAAPANQKESDILKKVDDFNSKLVDFHEKTQALVLNLEEQYPNCPRETLNDLKGTIFSMLEILNNPLLEPEEELEEESEENSEIDYPVYQKSNSGKSLDDDVAKLSGAGIYFPEEYQPETPSNSASSNRSRSSESQEWSSDGDDYPSVEKYDADESPSFKKCDVVWDLRKHEQYTNQVEQVVSHIQSECVKIKNIMYVIATHLDAVDTLSQVQKEGFSYKVPKKAKPEEKGDDAPPQEKPNSDLQEAQGTKLKQGAAEQEHQSQSTL